MSDAASADTSAEEPDGEDHPELMTGDELEMVWGNAFNRTADPVVWVDARCIGCERLNVCTVPADAADWNAKRSFADLCKSCSKLTPHNVLSTLTGLNRTNARGRVQRGDTDGQ